MRKTVRSFVHILVYFLPHLILGFSFFICMRWMYSIKTEILVELHLFLRVIYMLHFGVDDEFKFNHWLRMPCRVIKIDFGLVFATVNTIQRYFTTCGHIAAMNLPFWLEKFNELKTIKDKEDIKYLLYDVQTTMKNVYVGMCSNYGKSSPHKLNICSWKCLKVIHTHEMWQTILAKNFRKHKYHFIEPHKIFVKPFL